jgi:hypothetical protein
MSFIIIDLSNVPRNTSGLPPNTQLRLGIDVYSSALTLSDVNATLQGPGEANLTLTNTYALLTAGYSDASVVGLQTGFNRLQTEGTPATIFTDSGPAFTVIEKNLDGNVAFGFGLTKALNPSYVPRALVGSRLTGAAFADLVNIFIELGLITANNTTV